MNTRILNGCDQTYCFFRREWHLIGIMLLSLFLLSARGSFIVFILLLAIFRVEEHLRVIFEALEEANHVIEQSPLAEIDYSLLLVEASPDPLVSLLTVSPESEL